MEISKDVTKFIEWTKLKIRLHLKEDSACFYYHEREIWWASLGVNIGYEQDGKHENFERPILVLKKFNKNILWELPITSQNKDGNFYYQFEYESNKFSVILSQLRLISSKRLLRKIRTLSEKDFNDIKKRIKEFL